MAVTAYVPSAITITTVTASTTPSHSSGAPLQSIYITQRGGGAHTGVASRYSPIKQGSVPSTSLDSFKLGPGVLATISQEGMEGVGADDSSPMNPKASGAATLPGSPVGRAWAAAKTGLTSMGAALLGMLLGAGACLGWLLVAPSKAILRNRHSETKWYREQQARAAEAQQAGTGGQGQGGSGRGSKHARQLVTSRYEGMWLLVPVVVWALLVIIIYSVSYAYLEVGQSFHESCWLTGSDVTIVNSRVNHLISAALY